MSHTKEPWQVSKKGDIGTSVDIFSGDETDVICTCEPFYGAEEYNADRIVSCVNALAGIDNPAEFIKSLQDQNKSLREALKKISDIEDGCKQRGIGFDVSVNNISKDVLFQTKALEGK